MERYSNALTLKTSTGVDYKKSQFYPNIPLSETDEYVITTIGDRLDNLAYSYYRDSTLWWIIAAANNNATSGFLFPIPGTQLRIPTDLNKAKVAIEKGDVVAIPTETVYGLAANAYNAKAVKKIFSLKKRPSNNPLIIHFKNVEQIKKEAIINKNFLKLVKKFSPGPLTYVLKKKIVQRYLSLQTKLLLQLQ